MIKFCIYSKQDLTRATKAIRAVMEDFSSPTVISCFIIIVTALFVTVLFIGCWSFRGVTAKFIHEQQAKSKECQEDGKADNEKSQTVFYPIKDHSYGWNNKQKYADKRIIRKVYQVDYFEIGESVYRESYTSTNPKKKMSRQKNKHIHSGTQKNLLK